MGGEDPRMKSRGYLSEKGDHPIWVWLKLYLTLKDTTLNRKEVRLSATVQEGARASRPDSTDRRKSRRNTEIREFLNCHFFECALKYILTAKNSGFLSWTSQLRPESLIYTLKRDDTRPRPFHMGVPRDVLISCLPPLPHHHTTPPPHN